MEQVFPCEICGIFQNTYFLEHLGTADSCKYCVNKYDSQILCGFHFPVDDWIRKHTAHVFHNSPYTLICTILYIAYLILSHMQFIFDDAETSKSILKGAFSGLRQFLTFESPLKMMKNAFYFTLKARFVLKIFKLLSWLFDHVEKRLDLKDKVNFQIYDVTTWLTNNCNTHIDQHLKNQKQSGDEIWSVNRI